MTHHWDEFSKSLAEESLPRRETLRRLGVVLAGAILSPLGLESAWAGHRDPCKTYCRCRNKRDQNACLAACNDCGKDTRRVCGSCGSYVCCQEPGYWELGACISGHCEYKCVEGAVYCDESCTFLGSDVNNCGACGHICDPPGPEQYVACVDGNCLYACFDSSAILCDGMCTAVNWDQYNCGACGNVCARETPYCFLGECILCPPERTMCDNACVDLVWDANNCGACGNVCPWDHYCSFGYCEWSPPGEEPYPYV
jgi:hypothetical protein